MIETVLAAACSVGRHRRRIDPFSFALPAKFIAFFQQFRAERTLYSQIVQIESFHKRVAVGTLLEVYMGLERVDAELFLEVLCFEFIEECDSFYFVIVPFFVAAFVGGGVGDGGTKEFYFAVVDQTLAP